MWINQICRLCAQVSEVLFPIFEKDGDRPRLDVKIKKCLSLMISEDDSKPKQACYNCVSKLEDYNDFLEVCQSSDYKFESILYTANTNETVVEALETPRTRWDPDKAGPMTMNMNEEHQMAVQHDGVIVLGKMDETQNISRECQDILFMVELKYKDVDLDSQPTLIKENKMIYDDEDNEITHEKPISVFPPSVLRHSNDFSKSEDKSTNQDNIEQLRYTEEQQSYEQPIELLKPSPYTNCIQENKNAKPPKKGKPYACEHCSKTFMRRTNLNAHMSSHTQIRPYRCEQCDRSFALRWNLTVHQRLHTGLYSCEFCGKAFPVKGKLERHRRIHTGEKPFICTISSCDKAFADKRNLESHMRIHSEERPFVCEVCGRGFRSRSHLTDHQRVHSKEAPFTCDTCGKSFKWKTNLTIHLKGHKGETYVCGECGRQFSRSTQLVKHMKLHENFDMCNKKIAAN